MSIITNQFIISETFPEAVKQSSTDSTTLETLLSIFSFIGSIASIIGLLVTIITLISVKDLQQEITFNSSLDKNINDLETSYSEIKEQLDIIMDLLSKDENLYSNNMNELLKSSAISKKLYTLKEKINRANAIINNLSVISPKTIKKRIQKDEFKSFVKWFDDCYIYTYQREINDVLSKANNILKKVDELIYLLESERNKLNAIYGSGSSNNISSR